MELANSWSHQARTFQKLCLICSRRKDEYKTVKNREFIQRIRKKGEKEGRKERGRRGGEKRETKEGKIRKKESNGCYRMGEKIISGTDKSMDVFNRSLDMKNTELVN